jgi:hypothetical protein
MEGDQSAFRENIQSAFELGLRRDGIIVDMKAPNYLTCELRFAGSGGLVAYSYDVSYYTYSSSGPHRLQWTNGGIGTVGKSNLTADHLAKTCVDIFVNEWLKQNPKAR